MAESWRRPTTSSPVRFEIDPAGAHPPFEQLKSQVIERIATGELIVGTKLPAVRQLATDLGIAPNTVARAYRELEADGFVRTLGRNGTLINARESTPAELLQAAASQYAARATELGVPAEDAVRFVRSALGR